MDCSFGDIDLNCAQIETLSDESLKEDHGSTEVTGVPQEADRPEMVGTIEDLKSKGKEDLKNTDQEEPEEGEISDDNEGQGTSVLDNHDKDAPEGAHTPAIEPSHKAPKAASSSYGRRWTSGSNNDSRHGSWNVCSDASPYPVQPDKFYQFAWAKGVQESPNDSLGDSLQDERAAKTRKTGDSNSALNRSGSVDKKSGWIVGDRGIEFVKCMRSEDGYFFLHEGGDHSDKRREDGWRERRDRGSSERGRSSLDKSSKDYRNQSEERVSVHDRERQRSESRRSSRDIGRRDGRVERGLDDGDIELKQAIMADKVTMDGHPKGREGDKLYAKSTGLTHSVFLSEAQREKLFADVANNVKNVSVKDAQKSFMGVCRQLRRALRALRDLTNDVSKVHGTHIESQQRKVLALTRDIFSGIRATYAVRNTAVGKEQELDPNAFPRLLELARNRCGSLFTSKQTQELESMMQVIGYGSRTNETQKIFRKAKSAVPHQTERGELGDLKVGESSGNTSATTHLESESTTENSANVRTLEPEDEAEQPLSLTVDLNICESSAEQSSANALDSTTAGSTVIGGRFSSGPQQARTQKHYDAKEAESLPLPKRSTMVDLNEDQMPPEATLLERSKEKSGPGKDGCGIMSHFDPIRALTHYHEKFAGPSQAAHTRLPSPTPSDEGKAVENSTVDGSSARGYMACDDEAKPLRKDAQPEESILGLGSIRVPSLIFAHREPDFLAKESSNRPTLPELTLFPSSEMLTVEDGSLELHQTKMMPSRSVKKNRDPRKRLESQAIDLELPQSETAVDEQVLWSQDSSMNLLEPNQQVSQANKERIALKAELLSLLTLATGGGWSSEQMQMASITPGAGVRTVSNTSIEDSSQKKRQIDFLNEESFDNKRPRIALIVKDGDVGRIKAMDMPLVDSGENLKQELSSENLPPQSLKQDAHGTESGVTPLKQRMKPRDPRRVLLAAGVQDKSKVVVVGVAKGDSNSAAYGMEARMQTRRDAVVGSTEPVFSQDAAEKPVWAASTVQNEAFVTDRPVGPVNVHTVAPTESITKSEALPIAAPVALQLAGSAALLCNSDPSGNNVRPDELSKISAVNAAETKMNAVRSPGRFDLNVSASKQRDNVNHWGHLEPLLEGLDEKQKHAVRQERARRIEEQSRMFVAKKLCLVLDLDHTLLNSAKFTEIEEEWEAKLQANELTERNKFGKEGNTRRELYRFQHMGMWTKLRPGIWNFLARASHLYELHVYTMGNKAYATEMAKLLDPTGTLFAGRVISKGDDGDVVDGDDRPPKSKDLDGVLGMESAVVIIDDSARVWPHHRHNLIVVERYMYFPCSRRQFGLPGPSLLEVGHDEREQDGMLASALTVIEKVHYSFFSNPRLHEVDVRDILAKEQRRVLAGCKLIFSRVFPQGEIQPHLHPLWQLAEQFGAVCSMGVDDGVTHVVAISLGTEKVNWALSTGRYVVRPSWLEASAILYRRANERDFSVTA